jgi:hypothetical protein
VRKAIAGIFRFIARSIAVLFAALFVLAAVFVFLLLNLDHTLLNAGTYKRALVENDVYARLPGLVAEQFESLSAFIADPCAGNALGCAIDGASPELQACLTEALGPDAYMAIGTGKRRPGEAELQVSQPCLDRLGGSEPKPGPVANPLDGASPVVQECARQALGGEAYASIQDGGRPPDEGESGRINTCYAQAGETPRGAGGPMTFINNLAPEDWQALIAYLLPADELRQMTESTLDQVFAYLNGRTDTATISLVKLKARLAGQSGRTLLALLLDAQPPCTEEQLAQINADDFGAEGQPPVFCAASGAARERSMDKLQGQLDKAAAGIPDEAAIIKPISASDPSAGSGPLGREPVKALRMVRLGVLLSPLLPLALLLLVTLFGVRSVKGWLLWWGIPLTAAGLVALGMGIAVLPLLDWGWVHFAAARIPVMFASSSLVPLGRDLLRFVVEDLGKWMTVEAVLLVALGAGAIVGSFYIKPKPKAQAPGTAVQAEA